MRFLSDTLAVIGGIISLVILVAAVVGAGLLGADIIEHLYLVPK